MVAPSHRRSASEEPHRPLTFRAAQELSAFELARLWADPEAWPLGKRSVHDELAELAVMSALITWLRSWQPVAIHGAMRAGARPEAVAAALGDTVEVAYERWQEWAVNQREHIENGKPGLTDAEYKAVRESFTRSSDRFG
jgi:hypothetical protein